jgi:hypothetical protein
LDVASDAVVGENGVRFGHFAAAVDAGILGEDEPSNPGQREQGKQDGQAQFGALQRRRPFEIVQVDALREFFRCASACHVFCPDKFTSKSRCVLRHFRG